MSSEFSRRGLLEVLRPHSLGDETPQPGAVRATRASAALNQCRRFALTLPKTTLFFSTTEDATFAVAILVLPRHAQRR